MTFIVGGRSGREASRQPGSTASQSADSRASMAMIDDSYVKRVLAEHEAIV